MSKAVVGFRHTPIFSPRFSQSGDWRLKGVKETPIRLSIAGQWGLFCYFMGNDYWQIADSQVSRSSCRTGCFGMGSFPGVGAAASLFAGLAVTFGTASPF